MKRLVLGSYVARFGHDRKLRVALCLMALLGAFALPRLCESFTPELIYRKDVMQEYLLARGTVAGENPYQPLPELAYRFIGVRDSQILPHPTPHPPSVIPLVLWMGWFDYKSCTVIWFALELLFLGVSGYLAAKRLHLTPNLVWGTVIAMAMLGWYPAFLELLYGQLMLLLLMLLFAALTLLQRGKSIVGGILIGLAVAIKLFAWPLWVLLALRREWRALIAGVLCFGCLTALGSLMIGLDDTVHYYLDISQEVSKLYRACTYSYSLSTIGWRLFDGTRCETIVGIVADPVVKNEALAQAVGWGLPLGVLALGVVMCRKVSSYEAQYGMMTGVCILISPVAWMHYLVLAAIPLLISFACLQNENSQRSSRLRLGLLIAMVPTFLPEYIMSAFLKRFGTNVGVQRAGEVAVPFAIGLMTLVPMLALLTLLYLLWLVCQQDSACTVGTAAGQSQGEDSMTIATRKAVVE